MFIQNVSYEEVKTGNHFDCGENSMLIQIMDPNMSFPWPKHKFKEKYQFNFFDLDDERPNMGCINEEQAEAIVKLLQHALDDRMQVIVHCAAGMCRSGAIAEVGVMMGFQDTEKFRLPNTLVKRRMIKALGWAYDDTEPVLNMTDSGIIIASMSDYGG